ncbi:hypothetical protein [Candidatus Nitrososphaera gargensis]|nr:hypothetical protein [Candidatus Nitrososphaera gargensis]
MQASYPYMDFLRQRLKRAEEKDLGSCGALMRRAGFEKVEREEEVFGDGQRIYILYKFAEIVMNE